MRRTLVALLAIAAFPGSAGAAPVLVLGHDGQVTRRDDPFVPSSSTPPAATPARLDRTAVVQVPATPGRLVRAATASADAKRPAPRRRPAPTVFSVLAKLRAQGEITSTTYFSDRAGYGAALTEERHLSGTRRVQLVAVTETMHAIAASGQLTPSRLPALFAILTANRQWWAHGPLLSYGDRVEFAGSQLVWEYYPGQGLQLQVLGSFGKADGLYTAGPAYYPQMEQLLAQIIPLAAQRAGGLAWEYYFTFDGGAPPWTSAMSQATGLDALTRAYQATGNPYYLQIAAQAMPIFSRPPPVGVGVRTARGVRFLQYTFSPQTSIINAFLQTLIGLYDYSQVSGSPAARRLFAAGDAEAQYEVPQFNTGAWSLYQPGVEDELSYHELVTGFLAQLCTLTAAPVYCSTAQAFTTDLTTPPVLGDLTPSARRARAFALRFRLSKISHVGIVITRGSSTVFSTSASFGYGVDHFIVPALRHAGTYGVRLTGTDPAGNYAATNGTLTVR